MSLAESMDIPWRIIHRDGRNLQVSQDHDPRRINFIIENARITGATAG